MWFKSHKILLATQREMASRNIPIARCHKQGCEDRVLLTLCPMAPGLGSMWVIEKKLDLKLRKLRARV